MEHQPAQLKPRLIPRHIVHVLFAACMLCALPLLIAFSFLQKKIPK